MFDSFLGTKGLGDLVGPPVVKIRHTLQKWVKAILEQLGFNANQLIVVKEQTVIPAWPPPQNFGPPHEPPRSVRNATPQKIKLPLG